MRTMFYLKRIIGYILGFVLFYEPFMYFYEFVSQFVFEMGFTSIHVPCARIPLTQILTGDILNAGPISLIFVGLLIVSSFIFGPVFCGKLCPTGALPELLGNIIPNQFKVDVAKYIPPTPIRYGFTAGFLFSTYLGIETPCTFCNYYTLELFVEYIFFGKLVQTSLSLLLTFVLWLFVLGIFTKGGRGYCNYLCPVGAMNNFMHYLGTFIPGTFKMRVNENKCVGCRVCEDRCPMRSIKVDDHLAQINIHNCIICGVCKEYCPAKAISYSNKESKSE